MPRMVFATEIVRILLVRLKKSTNELRIKIDKPWDALSALMKEKLLEEARCIYKEKRFAGKLKEGWLPNFYSNSILVQSRLERKGHK